MKESDINQSDKNSYMAINDNKLARFAGILFLLQLIPYYLGHEVILGSILYQEDLLNTITQNRSQIALAVLLETLSAFSFIIFSVILYQMLKQTSLHIARLYLGIRFVEFTIILFSQMKLATLLSAAKPFTVEADTILNIQEIVVKAGLYEWEWISLIYMLVFCINALFFYYLLFQSRLVPRFISIWGFIGACLALSTPILLLFGQPTLGFIIYAPIGFNELFLAFWLIIKGINQNNLALKYDRT